MPPERNLIDMLPIKSGQVTLRPWRVSDRGDLVEQANSRAVWRNLTDVFPHPYTSDNAASWIEHCLGQDPPLDLVIEVDGRLAGVCGLGIGSGVSVYTGTIGYWLGESYWGRGVATSAVRALLGYVRSNFDLRRLQAEVFAWNPASARVLEKNGFELEGTRRRAIFKDGELIDEWIYARLIAAGDQE